MEESLDRLDEEDDEDKLAEDASTSAACPSGRVCLIFSLKLHKSADLGEQVTRVNTIDIPSSVQILGAETTRTLLNATNATLHDTTRAESDVISVKKAYVPLIIIDQDGEPQDLFDERTKIPHQPLDLTLHAEAVSGFTEWYWTVSSATSPLLTHEFFQVRLPLHKAPSLASHR